MYEKPKFLKEFSKTNFPEERKEMAKILWEKRTEYSQKQQELYEEMEKAENIPQKVDDYLKYVKIRGELKLGSITLEEKYLEKEDFYQKEEEGTGKINEEKLPPHLWEGKELVGSFYKELERKWAKEPYTNEEVKKYFNEEYLAALSLEDYILLMRRFPAYMFTNVVRQGVRDHAGHQGHTAGEGEFHNSFIKILESGRLLSRIGGILSQADKEKAIVQFMGWEKAKKIGKTKEQTYENLEQFCSKDASGNYGDKAAIHFAVEEVADEYYGAERYNEIFFSFPAALMASQYLSEGGLYNLEDSIGSGGHNDFVIAENELRGMDINAGIVFIPKGARVDKQTGSRYELKETGKPIMNRSYFQKLEKFIFSSDFNEYANIRKTKNSTDSEIFLQSLFEKYDISNPELKEVIMQLDHGSIELINVKKYNERSDEEKNKYYSHYDPPFKDGVILNILKNRGLLYKKAEKAIDSQEYWENYFHQHPEQKPSKVVYYEGGDPTRALHEWRKNNKIYKVKNQTIDNLVQYKNEEEARQARFPGVNRFRSIAINAIEKLFSQ